jgi:hypothetical protein
MLIKGVHSMGKRVKDITNQRFGSLVAKKYSHISNRMAYWEYLCDCGKLHVTRANTVSYRAKKGDPELPSCGCVELARKTKHGYRKAKDTHPTYKAWRGMLSRCYDSNGPGFKWYGAVGVTVCEEWKNNPQAFVEWSIKNGWKPGLHIDKDILCEQKGISPHIYSPETCQWVSAKTNVGFATNRKNYGKHPNVKLSEEEANRIIELYNSGEANGPKLAKMFGVHTGSIYLILKKSRMESNVSI